MRKVLIIVAAVAALFVGVLPDAKADHGHGHTGTYRPSQAIATYTDSYSDQEQDPVVVARLKSGEFTITGVSPGGYAGGTAGWVFALPRDTRSVSIAVEYSSANMGGESIVRFSSTSGPCSDPVRVQPGVTPSFSAASSCSFSEDDPHRQVVVNFNNEVHQPGGVLNLSGRLLRVYITTWQ